MSEQRKTDLVGGGIQQATSMTTNPTNSVRSWMPVSSSSSSVSSRPFSASSSVSSSGAAPAAERATTRVRGPVSGAMDEKRSKVVSNSRMSTARASDVSPVRGVKERKDLKTTTSSNPDPTEFNINIIPNTNSLPRPSSGGSTTHPALSSLAVVTKDFDGKERYLRLILCKAERWQDQFQRASVDHERTVHQLEERLQKLDSLLQKTLKEKNGFASVAAAREKELSDMNRRQTLLKVNLEKSEKSSLNLHEKVARSATLQRKVVDLEKKSGRIRSLAESRTASLDKLVRERGDLRGYIEDLQMQLDIAEAERQDLIDSANSCGEEKMAEMEEKVRALEKRDEQMKRDIAEIEREKEEAEERSRRAEKVAMELREEREKIVEELERMRRRVEELEFDRNRIGREMDEVVTARSGESARVKELQGRCGRLEEEREELKIERERLEMGVLDREERVGELERMVEELERERKDAEKRYGEKFEKARREVEEQREALKALRAAAVRTVEEWDAEVEGWRVRVDMAGRKIEAAEMKQQVSLEERERLSREVEKLESELAKARDDVARLEKESQLAGELEQRLIEARDFVEELHNRHEVAIQDLESESQRANELQIRNSELEQQARALQMELEAAREQGGEAMRVLRNEFQEAVDEIESEREISQQLRELVADLEGEVEKRKNEASEARALGEDAVSKLEGLLDATSEELDGERTRSRRLQGRLNEMEEKIRRSGEDADEAVQKLETRLSEERRRIEGLSDTLKDERQAREREMKDMDIRLNSLKEEMVGERERYDKEVATLRAGADRLRTDLANRVQAGMDASKAHAEELERMKHKLIEAHNESMGLQMRVKDGEMAVEEATGMIETLIEQRKVLEGDIAHICKEKDEVERILKEEEKKMALLEKEKEKVEKEFVTFRSEVGEREEKMGREHEKAQEALTSLKSQLRNTQESLEMQNEQFNDIIQKSDIALQQMTDDRDAKAAEADRKTAELDRVRKDLGTRLSLTETALQRANVAFEKLEQEMKEVKEEASEKFKTEVGNLTAEIDRVNADKANALDMVRELRQELDIASEDIETTCEALAIAERERDAWMEKHEADVQEMAGALLTAGVLFTEFENTQHKLNTDLSHKAVDLHYRLEMTESELVRRNEDVKMLEAEVKSVTQRADAEGWRVAGLEEELADEKERHSVAVEDARRETESLRGEMEEERRAMLGKIDDEKRRVEELEMEVEALVRELDIKREEVERTMVQVRAAEERSALEIDEKKKEIKGLEEQLQLERDAVQGLGETLAEKMVEAEALRSELGVAWGQATDLTEKLESAQQQYSTLQAHAEEAIQRERDAHGAEVLKLDEEVDRLQKLCEEYTTDIQKTKTRLQEASNAMEDAKQRAIELETQKTTLTKELDARQNLLDQREAELKAAVAEVANAKKEMESNRDSFVAYSDHLKNQIKLLARAVSEEQKEKVGRDSTIAQLMQKLSEAATEARGELERSDQIRARMERDHSAVIGAMREEMERANRDAGVASERAVEIKNEMGKARLRFEEELSRKDVELSRMKESYEEMKKNMDEFEREKEEVRRAKEEVRRAKEGLSQLELKCKEVVKAAQETSERSIMAISEELGETRREVDRLHAALFESEQQKEEVENKLSEQVQFLSKNYTGVYSELKRMSVINADLVGHQNKNQKIKRFAELQEERFKLRENLTSVTNERDTLRRKCGQLERELEAYGVIPAHPPSVGAKANMRQSIAGTASSRQSLAGHSAYAADRSFTSTISTGNSGVAPRKMSRIKRSVLASSRVANDLGGVGGGFMGGKNVSFIGLASDFEESKDAAENLHPDDLENVSLDESGRKGTAFFLEL
ncbi:hypothetical protein BC829DRAFT_414093 [Chytridium lagenaria]|nr:hypothetical protein BC829DRAFT_414093 [Chytridium lagenaria]